ncbi:MAG TPA: hypothetical protein VFB59_02120, partial [Candidatus Saccharimonadales bacterium]|nr:hypothetical protein [Candidatus Saccharimonadales bacterium]
QLSQKGQNIIDLLQAGRLQLDADSTVALARLIDEFIQFRMAHLAATRRQIPKAFPPDTPRSRDAIRQFGEQDIFDEGSMPGTAGFNAEHVLIGAISRLLELKDLSKAY